ncbi:MAG: hypothetical protein KF712_17780 [Akkermansiaceae bacterium]|nr:hypothetical protein [Akkermansiaceae bacterium]
MTRSLFSIIAIFSLMLPCQAQDELQKALDDVQEFTRQGKYKEALERHIWFHDHVLGRILPVMA